MSNKINSVLKEVIEKVKPNKEDIGELDNLLDIFLTRLKSRIKSLKLDAEIFVGGSYAKKTMIKKDKYDIDIFLRFDKKYGEEKIPLLMGSILKNENMELVHGSRDYFKKKISKNVYAELVPVRKIQNPKEAVNITDLSFLHVKYIGSKMKNKNILDEIRLAKAFCYANNCYGAESYVHGFSGYAIELLVHHYGNFEKFLRGIAKSKEREIIDMEKHYKNKNLVMMDVNSAKLNSPIILIDPTYKQRNALAGLSSETLDKFKKACVEFLKNPKTESFEIKEIDFEKIRKISKKNKQNFVIIEVSTDRQQGDIAGSKLFKFFRFLDSEISKFFKVNKKEFVYSKQKSADYCFVAKSKGEFIVNGPKVNDQENIKNFKSRHKKTFIKKNRIFAKEKINYSLKDFLEAWVKKNWKIMNEMGVSEIKITS
ncbi:MAG: nucleotidyltransferase domain-containing protein [Nanoarchaeota archaeon]